MNRQPHVGLTVLYYPAKAVEEKDPAFVDQQRLVDHDAEIKANRNDEGPVAAIVTRSFGNGGPDLPCINLSIFPDTGTQIVNRTSVPHQSNSAPGAGYWTYVEE